jgi:hypothetical protein
MILLSVSTTLPGVKVTRLILATAALTVLTGCRAATASPGGVARPATTRVTAASSPSPSPSASPIPATRADKKVCEAFALEQHGRASAETFNVWFLGHGNHAASKLITDVANWFMGGISHSPAEGGYRAMVIVDCASIGIWV